MSLGDASSPFHQSTRPVAAEFARLTAIVSGVYLWHTLVSAVLSTVASSASPPAFGGLLVTGLIVGGPIIVGALVFATVYADHRNISLGLQLPSRRDLPLVGVAGLVPLALVALTKLVGNFTGVPYNALLEYSVAADSPLLPVLELIGATILFGVPLFVILCQLLIQVSFRQVVDANTAIGLTTVLAGFVLLDRSGGGLAPVPDRGKLIAVLLFTLLLGFGPYVVDHFDPDRRPAVAYAPALLFGAFVVFSGGSPVDSLAGGLFIATHLAVLGVAAYSYDRTGSVLPPAVAYAVLELANTGVVYVFEAGMQSW